MKEFKPNCHSLGSEADDVIGTLSEQDGESFDHEQLETLTVLTQVAGQVMSRYGINGFEGFTNRQAKWACKLQSFFNLSNPFEVLVLLLFTFQFSQNEQCNLDIGKTEPIDRSHPLSQALMAWGGWDPSSETSRADRFYPWEYGEDRTSRMVAVASGLLPEPIDVTSQGDIPQSPAETQ